MITNLKALKAKDVWNQFADEEFNVVWNKKEQTYDILGATTGACYALCVDMSEAVEVFEIFQDAMGEDLLDAMAAVTAFQGALFGDQPFQTIDDLKASFV